MFPNLKFVDRRQKIFLTPVILICVSALQQDSFNIKHNALTDCRFLPLPLYNNIKSTYSVQIIHYTPILVKLLAARMITCTVYKYTLVHLSIFILVYQIKWICKLLYLIFSYKLTSWSDSWSDSLSAMLLSNSCCRCICYTFGRQWGVYAVMAMPYHSHTT